MVNPGMLHRAPFTIDGFKKVKIPKKLYKKLLVWYLQFENHAVIERMIDPNVASTIRNNTTAACNTKLLSLSRYEPLLNEFNEVMRRECSEWSGIDNLVHTSTYGIRTYHNGDILVSHTDRPKTHIISAICSIYQEDIEEPWGLQIKDSLGWWNEVFLEPGEMLFYESDILEHGRMYPLKGSKYANIFVHFKPENYDLDENGKPIFVKKDNEPNNIQRFEKVLSKKDCNTLIKEYDTFEQARTHHGDIEFDKKIRKAQNAVYTEESNTLKKVRQLIAEKTGTKIEQQEEPISIIKYEIGGEYKPHPDYYDNIESIRKNPEKGNRWKTAILYLNDDYEGGETHFPNWDVKVKGKAGELVTWTNINKDRSPNTDTLHAGLPVTKGIKYIVVAWIREFA